MAALIEELSSRWDAMFAALAAGQDLPPAHRLRAEGMMEAAVLAEMASVEDLLLAMGGSYRVAFGRSIEQDFGEDWREFYPFPQIPAMGRRAPVYPSTSD
jgi:hypothetical protein